MKETEAARAVLIEVLNARGAKNSHTKKFSTSMQWAFKWEPRNERKTRKNTG